MVLQSAGFAPLAKPAAPTSLLSGCGPDWLTAKKVGSWSFEGTVYDIRNK
jgi:hypothetical protein